MNPLRPPSSSSKQIRGKQGRAGQDRRAPTALDARFASVTAAPPAAPAGRSTSAAGEPIAQAAATYPTLASLEAAGFPAWWTSSAPLGSSEGMYPQGGFTNFIQSNISPENFHLVGNTARRTRISPTTPSFSGTPPSESNAQDKETINVDADETNKDGRTEKRLNWMKDEAMGRRRHLKLIQLLVRSSTGLLK